MALGPLEHEGKTVAELPAPSRNISSFGQRHDPVPIQSGFEPVLAISPGIDPRTMDLTQDFVQTFRGRIVEAP